jgi:NDP-4-keto-2,6-dideoxyhexose 3-C-methyltransferase
MYRSIKKCRVCGNPHLEPLLDLGMQALTGVFPAKNEAVSVSPLRLVKCHGTPDACGLLQLADTYSLDEMYGDNYGYRSGLNSSMVAHLKKKVAKINDLVSLSKGDLVIDIGSNDGTTLSFYDDDLMLVGVDPSATKFKSYYKTHIKLIPDFFSPDMFVAQFPGKKAKVITSFSMFYDLEDPVGFMRGIHECLADDGIWVFEQSYMPTMLEMNSFDTICHEHLEYYSLKQIKWMADRVGFQILNVEFNDVNGGSFSVVVRKNLDGATEAVPSVVAILRREEAEGLDTLTPYHQFADRVANLKTEFLGFLKQAATEGKKVAALGASTKGNVLLQYYGLGPEYLREVGEVNTDKFGRFTPSSLIPIAREEEVLKGGYDFIVVLPWHFRKTFESKNFGASTLVFPLPQLNFIPSNRGLYAR